ncbi:GL26007 [Drosophila persimilis]|uniref:GL26007 n=1 Tax=Drosophila persimilis TaxID=7234 RepID=B4GUI3_DROPE|nr:uncharacterized protein LOC6597087 isoform X2 [Drosophila persimilis]EDW26266.1 GL26007 [Drosophila persimilis]
MDPAESSCICQQHPCCQNQSETETATECGILARGQRFYASLDWEMLTIGVMLLIILLLMLPGLYLVRRHHHKLCYGGGGCIATGFWTHDEGPNRR